MNDPLSSSASRSQRLTRWLVLAWQIAVLALPVILLFFAVNDFRFNTYFLDDWVYVPLYEKAVKGGLTLRELFAGYLEHRIPVPKILSILGVLLTKGDVTVMNWLVYASLVFSWLGVGLLLWRVIGSWAKMWLPWALCGLALNSAVHWQILLWPSAIVLALPGFFLVMGLLALGSRRLGFWPKLVLTFLATCCGILSCASGLTLAILLPAAALCGYGMQDRRMANRFFGVLGAGMVVVIALYLHNLKSEVEPAFAYGQENGASTLKDSIASLLFSNPGRGVPYFIAQMGTNLCRGLNADRRTAALVMGSLVLVIYLGFLIQAWRGRKEGLLTKAAPFLALGGYSIGSAMLITLGRAWVSPSFGGALNNRYSGIAAMLIVSLVGLSAILWAGSSEKAGARIVRGPLMMMAGVLAMLLVVNWCHGYRMMEAWQGARLRGAVDIHFSQVLGLSGLSSQKGRDRVRHQIALAKERAKTLDELGFLHRPLARDLRLSQFKLWRDLSRTLGDVVSTSSRENKIYIEGYALLRSVGRPADGVLVTSKPAGEPDAEPMIIDISYSDELPAWLETNFMKDYHFIVKNLERPQLFGKWRIDLDRARLRPGKHKIECWALDFKDGSVRRIGDGFFADGL